ncbi:MAG TPA: CAP domain-containing protein [Gaiellales bacterium]
MARVRFLSALVAAALVATLATAVTSEASIKATDQQTIEQGMLTLVNTYRVQHGLVALKATPSLMHAARWHSRDMADNGYFDHTSPDGEQFSQRLTRFGFHWTSAGEAIGEASGLASATAAASAAFTMWRESPPHNKIMLTGSFRNVGIGTYCGPDTGGGATCEFTLDAARG